MGPIVDHYPEVQRRKPASLPPSKSRFTRTLRRRDNAGRSRRIDRRWHISNRQAIRV